MRVVQADEDPVQSIETGFGERVRDARLAREWTQKQLAEKINLDASAVSRLEQGSRAIRLGEAARIARALNTDLGLLVHGELDPATRLRDARRDADRAMHVVRRNAVTMTNSFVDIADLLEVHPQLFDTLKQEDGGGPTTVDEYFEWVFQRMQKVFDPDGDEHSYVTDPVRIKQLKALLSAALDGVVSDVPYAFMLDHENDAEA